MKKIHIILILVTALWNSLPTGSSSLRSLFDLSQGGLDSGDVVVTSDPDSDPIIIITPPPR